jgi:hypothetical protein
VVGPNEGLPGSLDVIATTASQGGDDRSPNSACNGLHGMEVPVGSDRKPGFNYIDTQLIKLLRKPNFFGPGHATARGLLSIAQGSVEYLYMLSG